jgi:hypothetical protein
MTGIELFRLIEAEAKDWYVTALIVGDGEPVDLTFYDCLAERIKSAMKPKDYELAG